MAEAPVYDEKLRQYVLLSDYLIPYLKRSELDTEAETILRLFYPEALVSPVPVNAFRLAGNMGFSVRKAF